MPDDRIPFTDPEPLGSGSGASDAPTGPIPQQHDTELNNPTAKFEVPLEELDRTHEAFREQPTEVIADPDEFEAATRPYDFSDLDAEPTQQLPRYAEPVAAAPTQPMAAASARTAPPSPYTATARERDARSGRIRDLSALGWLRLLLAIPLLVAGAWLLFTAGASLVGQRPITDLLLTWQPFAGLALVFLGIFVAPGPGGGKAGAGLFALVALAVAYFGLWCWYPGPAGNDAATAQASTWATALSSVVLPGLVFWLWMALRGKRGTAWLLVVFPLLISAGWMALSGGLAGGGFLGTGAYQLQQFVPAPEAPVFTDDLSYPGLLLTLALLLCVVPATLMAWPIESGKQVRHRRRHDLEALRGY